MRIRGPGWSRFRQLSAAIMALALAYTVSLFFYQSSVLGLETVLQIRVPPAHDWQIHLLIALWMGITVAMPENGSGYATQIIGVMLYAVVSILKLGPNGFGGELLVLFAFALVYKYRLLDRHPVRWLALIIAPWLTARVWQALYGRYPGWSPMVNNAVIVPVGIAIIWWLFEGELVTARRHRDALRLDAERNGAFVEFGRNVAGIVHDLNGDVGVLSGLRTLCAGEIGEPLDRHRLETLDAVTRRLSDRVRKISAVTRSSVNTEIEDIDIAELLRAAVFVFNSDLDVRKHVRLRIDAPGEPLLVRTSPSALLSLAENLISNSCHALVDLERDEPGEVTILIRREAGGATITISDNGPGLPPEIRCPGGNCFESPDFRIGRSTRPDGSGIGMLNARQSAERLGAEVLMTSVRERGVTTRIILPSRGSTGSVS